MSSESLSVDDLCVDYLVDMGAAHGEHYAPALRTVSLHLREGRSLGILGETGSGKSSLGLAIMRLLPDNARMTGRVRVGGVDVTALSEKAFRRYRGRQIGMISQDASSALNPVRTVGAQIAETARTHRPGLSRREAKAYSIALLEDMGVPGERHRSYPHQLSGGMRQRASMAAVMACNPALLIADECTSDLDKITEHRILLLLKNLRDSRGLGLIVISHDVGVVSTLCHEMIVMYGGEVVEYGETKEVLSNPQHGYTETLLRASRREKDERGRLITVRADENLR